MISTAIRQGPRGWKGLRRAASLLAILAVLALPLPAHAQKALSLGTAASGGTVYLVGAGLAQLVNKFEPDLRVTAESTAGSVANVNLVLRHQLDIGMSSYLVFPKIKENRDVSDLRLITMGHGGFLHFFVRKDSPIKDINEIRGKRMTIGGPGTAHLVAVETVLKHGFGMSLSDVRGSNLDIPATVTAIKDNTIDVGTIGSATPVSALLELSSTVGIRFLSLTDEQLQRIEDNSPFVASVLEAGTYPGQDQDVKVAAYPPVMLYCHKDMDEEVVYKFIKAIFSHPEERNAIHPQAKFYSPETAFRGTAAVRKNLGFGFHPGAERYLREIGIWNSPKNAFAAN